MLLQHLSQLLEMRPLRRSLLQYMDLTILALVDTLLVEAGLLFMQQEVQQVLVVLVEMVRPRQQLQALSAQLPRQILVPVAVAEAVEEMTHHPLLMEVMGVLADQVS
jgi:hypothetical protein